MSHKVFLSHNHNDKPLVEAVAVRLAGIFGQDQVFYDSWSIKPGDGIIDQMNKGLEAPEFVFFFVSANSLSSGMVKLEWQNAVYSATKGKTRIIPVRVDGTQMPPVLMQTLYIDMHTIGLEAAIAQIVSVTQGNASFTPQHQGFSNLAYSITTEADGTIDIVVRASHLMEPNPNFLILVGNPERNQLDCTWCSRIYRGLQLRHQARQWKLAQRDCNAPNERRTDPSLSCQAATDAKRTSKDRIERYLAPSVRAQVGAGSWGLGNEHRLRTARHPERAGPTLGLQHLPRLKPALKFQMMRWKSVGAR